MNQKLQQEWLNLIEEDKIRKLQYRYARAVDQKDYDAIKDCFTDIIAFDLSDDAPEMKYDEFPAQGWVDMVKSIVEKLESTQHFMGNMEIDIQGECATAIVYLQAQHYLPNNRGKNFFECGGYYENSYIKVNGNWKINAFKFHYLFRLGNQYVITSS